MDNWVFNTGKGSYRVSSFDEESKDLHFGLITGRKNEEFLSKWESKEIVDNDQETTTIEATFEDGEDHNINGLTEYGFGFWTRFLWNGKVKLIEKPDWMGLARLTINKDYE
jgi:hypothetical protein